MPEDGLALPLQPPRGRRERRLQVYVERELAERLEGIAEARGETVSYIAAVLLRAALAGRGVAG